ncbi:sensor histidine kinase [Sinosporangium siamense]|uniref:histidine kinase n=2 Tax=Sinosporangium siamense TaxID=1367973 RepID=A0A919RE62_9ACTN|nr:HAMP domain-containing sensor histidine kinase [Sinosporangium siamense]GII90144.1 two-component sensor histidine kinase [Sinosporangium siamense]
MRTLRRARVFFSGLRTRMVLVFLALAVLSALAAAVLIYSEARSRMLDRTQTLLIDEFRARVETHTENLAEPLGKAALQQLANRVAPGFLGATGTVVYKGGEAVSSRRTDVPLSSALRIRVTDSKNLHYERVLVDDMPYLMIGTPVMRGTSPSGLEVYLTMPLTKEQSIDVALGEAARNAILPVLTLAVVLALLAAHSVLRPVRALDRAARALAQGRLDTRLAVEGGDELARLAQTFNTTAAALESSVAELRAMEAKARQFVADVSHEMRTPLASMVTVADVLDEEAGRLPGDVADAARLMNTEVGKLATLVEDLMEISRFDAGAVALNPAEVDVAGEIGAALRRRGWAGAVSTQLEEKVMLHLDPRRFDLIVANLVGNALRHGAPPVTVRLARGLNVIVEVADRGPGLAPESLPHVFDRFYKADSARSRSAGSGLGLAIARENALLHGGALTAANRPGGGAVFTLTLPVNAGLDDR